MWRITGWVWPVLVPTRICALAMALLLNPSVKARVLNFWWVAPAAGAAGRPSMRDHVTASRAMHGTTPRGRAGSLHIRATLRRTLHGAPQRFFAAFASNEKERVPDRGPLPTRFQIAIPRCDFKR